MSKRTRKMTTDIPEITIASWRKFRETFETGRYQSWAFRGQADAEWRLFSSLSRYLQTWDVHPKVWPVQEERILRIFRRKAHHFLGKVPDEADSFQWLSVMQHHGAPTRLLDFTWSPYVAAFFALERAQSDAAIWAIHPPSISSVSSRTIRASQRSGRGDIGPWNLGKYEKHYLPNKRRIVAVGEPHTMNQRLIAQSGTFVMPGLLDEPVEWIVQQVAKSKRGIVKFRLVSAMLRNDAMAALYSMNITNATLFPDLGGLARSLAFELEFHWGFNPRKPKPREGFLIH